MSSLLLILALNWTGLSTVYSTVAYLSDTEGTPANSFVAGALDFALIASEGFGPLVNTSFEYDARPDSAYVDGSTTDVSGLLGSYNPISVDTSDGDNHYIYLNWDLGEDIANYENTDYFNLKLQHKEDTTIIKVELKNDISRVESHLTDEIDGLKAELSTTVSKKEFNQFKTKVDDYISSN